MRASVLGTGHCLAARARVKVASQAGSMRACTACTKMDLIFLICRVIMHAEFWLAGWLDGWMAGGQRQTRLKWAGNGKNR